MTQTPPGDSIEAPQIKALTIKQPWCNLIVAGHKTIETRTWSTQYRGPIAIHAAKTPKRRANIIWPPGTLWATDKPRGAILAVANLTDCRPMTTADEAAACCHWEPGKVAWILSDIRPLTNPIPIEGRLGLWNWTPPQPINLPPTTETPTPGI